MTVRLPMLGETHILKSKNKIQISASGVREASRSQVTLCIDFRNGYDAYNCSGMQRSRAWCKTPPILRVVNMVRTRNFTCYMGAL